MRGVWGTGIRDLEVVDTSVRGTALVVMELGSVWPAHPEPGLDVLVLRQENDECELTLVRRTLAHLRAIERRGGRVHSAFFSCNDGADRTALECRTLVARALLGSLVHVEGGRLLLVGRASSPAQHALLALAETLTLVLVGSEVSVSARFVGGPRRPPAPLGFGPAALSWSGHVRCL